MRAYVATYSYTAAALDSLARVLFGELDPSGRLPVTIPNAKGTEDALPLRPRAGVLTCAGAPSSQAHRRHRRGVGVLASARRPRRQVEDHGHGGRVLTGFDTLARDGYRLVSGERVGLISNPTGVVTDLRHEVDVMAADDRVDLVAAFGPEHGFRGSAQAGGSEGDYLDPRTGIPVYDTYTKTPAQIADFFAQAGVDTVMFDIQDVGARFYTYIWTMYDCMVAAPRWPACGSSCSTGPTRSARPRRTGR